MTGPKPGSEPSNVTSRPSVVYNLERGAEHSPPPSRPRQMFGVLTGLFTGEWSWQTIVVWVLIVLLVIGAIVESTGHGIINAWLRRMHG